MARWICLSEFTFLTSQRVPRGPPTLATRHDTTRHDTTRHDKAVGLVAAGGCWWLLVAAGGCWWLLVAAGGSMVAHEPVDGYIDIAAEGGLVHEPRVRRPDAVEQHLHLLQVLHCLLPRAVPTSPASTTRRRREGRTVSRSQIGGKRERERAHTHAHTRTHTRLGRTEGPAGR
jgi:hypothetical protein